MMTETTKQAAEIRPASTICEEDGNVVLRLEMPGVGKDALEINIDSDTLTVRGRRDDASTGSYLVRERRHGDYRATFTLDERVNRDKVDAKMVNGILTLTLHLKDEVKPRQIKVKTA
jgi:HSP20 family protein